MLVYGVGAGVSESGAGGRGSLYVEGADFPYPKLTPELIFGRVFSM